ncbi:hypothetical protein MYX06_04985 [Patescibacteria group bacterium AH-259-L05]|nr:hypothetical protein [Patescibacteria group bacterium AH-259-L05]
MPINLLGGEDGKKELAPEKQEQVSREMKMVPPSEQGALHKEERGAGISDFFKKKDKKPALTPEPKQEEPKPEPKPEEKESPPVIPHEVRDDKKEVRDDKKEVRDDKKEERDDKRRKEKKERKKKKEKDSAEKETGSFDISLMPSRLMVIPRTVRSSFLLFIAVLITVGTIFGLVWAYTDWHFEKIKFRVHKIQGEMQLLEAKSTFFLEIRGEIASLESKAQRVEGILNNHIYWTKFFSLLEAYTIPDVYFGDFSAITSGNIHLDVVAKDLTALATQLVSFKTAGDFVEAAEVSGIRKIPSGIAAAFDLALVDDVFYK